MYGDRTLCKLSVASALQNMVDAAGEVASEVRVRIRQRSQVLGREASNGSRSFQDDI